MSRPRAFAASFLLLVSSAAVTVTAHANPLGLSFKATTNTSLYGKPTGMLIAGRCNRYDSAFQTVRTKGGEVLAYLNPINRPNRAACALDSQFYMGDVARVPLWPYPSYGQRQLTSNTKMTDMRPGSRWITFVVGQIEKLMREGKVDGVFLDNVGARSWMPLAEWKTWSQKEKDLYTDGNIELVRRIDELRRRIKPSFIVVNNSLWDRGDTRGLPGERYVDGVSIEHPPGVTTWHTRYAGKAFSNLGHRRVLIIASSNSEALAWSKVKGVTHTSAQLGSEYGYPEVPVVPFVNLD
jgi:hypothetical protein